MVVDLGPGWAVVASAVAWTVIGVVSGWLLSRVPDRRLDHDSWLTAARRFEDGGRFWERRLRVRLWKDRLPEAGSWFGGTSKATLVDPSTPTLQRLAIETRRAEVVHWVNASAGPVFLIWCPLGLGLFMCAFGLVVHLPFVVIQRSNRFRVERTLARRRVRATDHP